MQIRALLLKDRVRPPGTRAWTNTWVQWLEETEELSKQTRWVVDRQLVRLSWINREIVLVESRLAALTAEDPVVQRLFEFKGVELITAVTIRAEIGRFDRFRSGKQLARFCGLTPRNASSGQRQADAGLIRAGNPQLRTVLVEAAHRLMRYEPRWVKLAHTLRKRGKPISVVTAAVVNRWVRWLFHQMQSITQAA